MTKKEIQKAPKWDELTKKEQDDFTMRRTTRKVDWYFSQLRQNLGGIIDDGIAWTEEDQKKVSFFKKAVIDKYIEEILSGKPGVNYPSTDPELWDCLKKYPIKNKSVAILGSTSPYYEALCLAYEGIPTTIEYNNLKTDDDRLTLLTVEEYQKNRVQFDAVISISSIEHDGLGRYGDPIDPYGDFKAMENIRKNVLKKGGLLYLAVPVGVDTVVFNAHRIYGTQRWPLLVRGFDLIYAPSFDEQSDLRRDMGKGASRQPVVVLKKK